ncbi:MotA/TolQ/ExbB proton channel family protein [Labrys wisconsinensis]|uniref:Biopolymer transport protein ExbB/TolQ n=1 Tax=Labrys wisconsinensis TaxID=425677 RepID=A0ABU0JCF3_9HYPH|nr:MotA/TolQ/ExbB proton channel family protein [Labrys wisconsinensis]MDQ0471967.1 biopolymer transport protein ExbB/TolQ [Labrys wisconsinensis]
MPTGLLTPFLDADPIVKGVMVLLVLASVGCWTVILEKSWRMLQLRRRLGAFDAWRRGVQAGRPALAGTAKTVAEAGLAAWRDQDTDEARAERRERIERSMRLSLNAQLRELEWGLPFLASVGSVTPFIGLFGTVWGIMRSFSSIAASQDTSLAVVAPGIAEALSATALGLFAAIPAVLAYNHFVTELDRSGKRFGTGIAELAERFARERPGAAAGMVD